MIPARRAAPRPFTDRLLADRLFADRRGATAVEAALVLPVLLMLLLGCIEVGRAGWMQVGLNFAVQEAARCAAVQTTVCTSDSVTQSYAAKKAAGLNIPAQAFTVSRPACGVQVAAAQPYGFLALRLTSGALILKAQACHA